MRPWVGAEGLVWAGGGHAVGHGRRPGADRPPARAARVRRGARRALRARDGRRAPGADRRGARHRARSVGLARWRPSAGSRWSRASGRAATTGSPAVASRRRVANAATLGVSYVQRREDGEISNEEVGRRPRGGARPLARPRGVRRVRRHEPRARRGARVGRGALERLAGRALRVAALARAGCCRRRRSSRCSATCRRRRVGATVRWRAAPRLDLLASGAGQDVAGGLGGNGWVRATLRLDDRGDGSLGLEVRRVDVPGAQWTGVRAIAALPLGKGFRYSSELEIVVPDHPDGRGAAWPWGLSALSWRSPRRLGGRRRARGVVDAAASLRGRRPRAPVVRPRRRVPRAPAARGQRPGSR